PRVKLVAVSALLARHYPEPGTRHEFVMALAGMLLQSQWPVEKVNEFISATARAAGDEEWKARTHDVTSTAQRVAQEKPVTGVTRLKELVGEEVIARVQPWLDLSERGSEVEHLTDLGNARRFVAQHGNE